jgi:hypothetical protein
MIKFLVKLANFLDKVGYSKDADTVDEVIKEAKKKKKDKWIQKATSTKTEGKFTAWCKKNGFKKVCQACINKAVKTGGSAAKMALFAANTSKGKYTYPKKKAK